MVICGAIEIGVMSEKVCKILLSPSPLAWGTPSQRGICDVVFCRFT